MKRDYLTLSILRNVTTLSIRGMTIWNGSRGTGQKDIAYSTKKKHGSLKNMAASRVWRGKSLNDPYDVDYKVSLGSEDKSIVSHLGYSETGVLPGCLLLFTGRKREDPNYHSEMNSIAFYE